jgi:excisionase family DNA binding protein
VSPHGSEAPAGARARSARQATNTSTADTAQTELVTPERLQHSRRLLTIAEAADILAISIASVRRLIGAGQLSVVRFNRRLLIDTKDLEAFIHRAKQPGI